MARVTRYADEAAVATAGAERVAACIEDALAQRQNATLCLTGGNAAGRLYDVLADPSRPWRGRIDWSRVHAFWGDERHVPPDHPDSNYGMAARRLLDHVPLPAHQVHRIPAELPDASAAARAYEAALQAGFAQANRADQTFDLVLLGLGADGHIASILPGSPLLHPSAIPAGSPRVAAVWAAHLHAWRITLTPAAILDCRRVLIVASGAEKAAAVHAALDLPADVARWPVQLLSRADDRVEWLMDAAAAALWRGATPS